MRTTIELVTAVRDLYGSDRKAATAFGVTQAAFSDWRNGDAFPTDDHALKIAERLKLDARYVLAVIRRDRAPSERARAVWSRIAEGFAVLVLSIGAASFGAPSAQAGFNNNVSPLREVNTHCIAGPRQQDDASKAVRASRSRIRRSDPKDLPLLRASVERHRPLPFNPTGRAISHRGVVQGPDHPNVAHTRRSTQVPRPSPV